MTKRINHITKILAVLALALLPACSALPPSLSVPSIDDSPTQDSGVVPLPTYPPIPTLTPSAISSPTETPQLPAISLSTATPDSSQAELNSRIEELEITVTAAARELSALQATNVALAATAAASSGNSGSSSSPNSEYDIPSYVVEITFIEDAILRDQVGTNNKDAPIMAIREPRVKLPSGTHSWVTNSRILADGGTPYYEIYDPDGEVSRIFFIRLKDMQIRKIGAQPFADNIPLDVVLVEFSDKTYVRSIHDVRANGKPVMRIHEPRILFNAGDRIYVRIVPVVADGGTIYYEIFDTDGQSTQRYFIREQDITIPNIIK